MVRINLIMEGAPPQAVLNESAKLMDPTNVLRQSLNRFFQRLLNRSDIQVAVDLGANKNSSVYKYARNRADGTFLYVDLDAPSNGIGQWFKYHKLKSAPSLLDALDVNTLLSLDSQLMRFKATF